MKPLTNFAIPSIVARLTIINSYVSQDTHLNIR